MKMRKIVFSGIAMALCASAFMACNDDDFDSYVPAYKGFSFNKGGVSVARTQLKKNDSITVTAVQARVGRLLNKSTYTWTMRCGSKIYQEATNTVVYDNNQADPIFKMAVPDTTATVTISFHGEFNYSGEGKSVDSPTYDSDPNISGSIAVTGSNVLKGTVAGSITFTPKD